MDNIRVPSNTFQSGGDTKDLNWTERIAYSKESQLPASRLVQKYGYKKPNNKHELAHSLSAVALNYGEPALLEIMAVHPDREIIMQTSGIRLNDSGNELAKLNCEGCGGTCGGAKKLNSCGCSKMNDGGGNVTKDSKIDATKAEAVKGIATTHMISRTVLLGITVVAFTAITIYGMKFFKKSSI